MKVNLMITAVWCCMLASCMNWGSRQNSRLIEQAQQLMEQKPDSALILLDMVNAASFGKAAKAEYALLRVQARSNAGLDITSETEIFNAREFLIRKNDPEKAALACFFAGETLFAQGKVTEAVEFYLEANDIASQYSDNQLKGRILNRIGDANHMLGLYEHSMSYWMQALVFYRAAGNMRSEIGSMIKIGNCYLLENQNDSALALYGRAEKMACSLNDTAMQLSVLQNMGVVYLQTGDRARAADMYHSALTLATRRDSAQLFSNLASLYLDTGEPDTAFTYNNVAFALLDSTINNPLLLNVYYQMLLIEAHRGNGDKVIEYFSKYLECLGEVLNMEEKKSLLDLQKKYDMTSKENELNRKRSRAFKFAGISLMVLLAMAVVLIGVLQKSVKQKTTLANAEREKEEKTMELEKAQQRVYTLQELYNQRDNQMKTIFLEKIGVIKEVALLAPYLKIDAQKSKNYESLLNRKTKDIFKKLNPQNFIDIANELYPDFTNRLKQFCSELDDREICVCCLIMFDFNNEELDLFINSRLNGSLSTVQNWKSAIRRKLKIQAYGDIKSFLTENISGHF